MGRMLPDMGCILPALEPINFHCAQGIVLVVVSRDMIGLDSFSLFFVIWAENNHLRLLSGNGSEEVDLFQCSQLALPEHVV